MLLGFDIGGTKCAVVLGELAEDNAIRIRAKRQLTTTLKAEEMIELLFKTAEELLKAYGILPRDLEGIGISCGGPLSGRRGVILSPPNLPGWLNIPIVEMGENRFHTRVILQNDANACAIAEWKYGAGMGLNNLIFLTFGTGMGAGLILDGKLYEGKSELAGEVGHIRLSKMGPVGFGKAGSFEGFCSGGGIAQLGQMKARERLQTGEAVSFCPGLEDLQGITAKSLAEAATKGDELALSVYSISAEYLGRALALFIDILNPEMIVLGSIYGRARHLLEPRMREVIESESYCESWKACNIVPAGLGENIGDIAALSLALWK